MPAALLDNVSKLTLTVVDTSGNDADCDTSTGVTSGDLSQPILTKDLASSGCANGAKFCGDLQITESDHVLVFAAAGYDGWYVLEQDTILTEEPGPGAGPIADVLAGVAYLEGR